MKKLPKEEIKKVIVRSPNWLGDALMCLPVVKALNAVYRPEALTVLARKPLGEVYSRFPFVTRVAEFDRAGEAQAHAKESEQKADLVVLFANSFRSAWNAVRTDARFRLGYGGNFRSLLLTHPVPRDDDMHMADFYLGLLRAVEPETCHEPAGFPLEPEETAFAAGCPAAAGGIGIPLGANYGPAKCWPEQRLAEFIRLTLDSTDKNIVLFGTGEDGRMAARLAALSPARVVNLTGKTSIGEMAAVMERCGFIVANDSGPLHIAAALGKKTVALFGSTEPNKTAPRVSNVRVVMHRADCAPCFKRECPTDFVCMQSITAEEVLKEIQEW